MEHVGSLLKRMLAQRGLGDDAAAALVMHRATALLAKHVPEFAESIHARKFADGTLTIAVDTPVAEQRMALASPEFANDLATECELLPPPRIVVVGTS